MIPSEMPAPMVKPPLDPAPYLHRFARSIESGWTGKIVKVHTDGRDAPLEMKGVNGLYRAMHGGDIEDALDHDDIQWFAPEDVRLLRLI